MFCIPIFEDCKISVFRNFEISDIWNFRASETGTPHIAQTFCRHQTVQCYTTSKEKKRWSFTILIIVSLIDIWNQFMTNKSRRKNVFHHEHVSYKFLISFVSVFNNPQARFSREMATNQLKVHFKFVLRDIKTFLYLIYHISFCGSFAAIFLLSKIFLTASNVISKI